jgi:hypothetical protein
VKKMAPPNGTKAAPPPSLGPKEMYLIAYNGLCCLGWAYVLALGVPSLLGSVRAATASGASFLAALKTAGAALYHATPATAGWSADASPSLAAILTVVQGAAALEVAHAAAGLVRSPVVVTALQVGSRLVALHMVRASPTAQSEWRGRRWERASSRDMAAAPTNELRQVKSWATIHWLVGRGCPFPVRNSLACARHQRLTRTLLRVLQTSGAPP